MSINDNYEENNIESKDESDDDNSLPNDDVVNVFTEYLAT